jgi:hypothetical protein
MKSAALAKIRKMQLRKSASVARARAAAKATVKEQQGMLISGGTGFGIGFAENKGFALPTIDKIEPVALYALASIVGAYFIKDRQVRDILKNTGVGLGTVALYKAGRNGFDSMFNYQKPVEAPVTATAGWGEEIVETGEF